MQENLELVSYVRQKSLHYSKCNQTTMKMFHAKLIN